ncbi:MAG: hypothetical protein HY906_02205 [Deltaproteobacteria bacterium]|nr:hypothetical protein [Deltaproteobacteria bacterium]
MVLRGLENVLREADEYFMGTSRIQKTARELAARLRAANVDFAIAGALALNVHGVVRMTEDVDVLITRDGLRRFKDTWLGRGYVEIRPGGKPIRNTETLVKIDFLVTGDYPGDGLPKPVSFPVPAAAAVETDDYPVLSLPRLVELKLASGMTAKDRLRDLDDVMRLVRSRHLPRELQDELDPYVREKFLELWQLAVAPEPEY